jgi:hypothetical protein
MHRWPLTGERWDLRWDLRWLNGRGKTPTFFVFLVFRVVVIERCCDACGDGEYCFRSVCSALVDASVIEALIAVDRKSIGHSVAERS